MTSVIMLDAHRIYIVIQGNEHRNALLMKFRDHVEQSYSIKQRYADHETKIAISHNTISIRVLSHNKVM